MNFVKAIFVIVLLSFSAFAQEVGGVKGKVRNLKGQSIPEVTVSVSQGEKEVKTLVTNKKGEFLIENLKAGKYNFTFNKDGYSTGSLNNVEIGNNKVRDLGNRLVLDLDEGTLVIIKGSVFNQDGRSIYGAKVEISRVLSDGSVKKVNSSYSSESGQFVFRFSQGLATFRITASLNGKSASKDVTVEEPAIYRLALSLNLEKENNDN